MLFENAKTSLWLFFFLRPQKQRFVLWFQMNGFFGPLNHSLKSQKILNTLSVAFVAGDLVPFAKKTLF